LIEGSEIFQMIEKDSQTDRQVIEETNYIMKELKEYRNSYAEAINKCRYCGGDLKLIDNKDKEKPYMECEECKRANK
jgi:predicted Zn-ribbon and HTH transcriptional regulator